MSRQAKRVDKKRGNAAQPTPAKKRRENKKLRKRGAAKSYTCTYLPIHRSRQSGAGRQAPITSLFSATHSRNTERLRVSPLHGTHDHDNTGQKRTAGRVFFLADTEPTCWPKRLAVGEFVSSSKERLNSLLFLSPSNKAGLLSG